jgi:hypothetical protein
MYDLIGDIHGHADELVDLLDVLGYRQHQSVYEHPDRKVIFLGDFIDRGPQIRQALQIVRPMIEAGTALSVMGNHELNALAYHTADAASPGESLRRHTPKNEKQHGKTLEQLKPDEFVSYLDWFRTLPMWLDLDGLRVVHACWDEANVKQIAEGLRNHQGLTADFLQAACTKGNALFDPVDVVLKGRETALPEGVSFQDKDGHVRTDTRVRWYADPRGHTYRSYAFTDEVDCDKPLEKSVIDEAVPYATTAKPVFVGHYWLSADRPEILAENVACLDYSVAKGGFLCAYRWQGEQKLKNEHFVRVAGDLIG